MGDIRPIQKEDFVDALRHVKATVTKKDLTGYLDWNTDFGSFEISLDEIDN
jgi:Vps4 C terminal oligomerisation domain